MFRFHVEDRVLHMTIGRPEKRGALLPAELPGALAELERQIASKPICAVVLRGTAGFFCAGYDIASIPSEPDGDGRMVAGLDDFIDGLCALPMPTIAMVEGGAFGAGFELALACDMRLTTDTARWCMPPAKLGLLYSLAGMRRLEAAVGAQRARYLLYTAAVIPGERAAAWGLALDSHGAEGIDAALDQLLAELRAVHSPSAQAAKALLAAASPEASPELTRRAEAMRAELFARAKLPTGR